MRIFKYLLITLFSLIIYNSNAQNLTFGCTDTAAANYDPNADQPLEGLVEASSCNFIWFQNYVGINETFYNNYSSEFAVGTKITFAGQEYWIDAVAFHSNCNAGVALVYVANSPGQADGNEWTVGGMLNGPVFSGTTWSITECFYNPGCMDDDYVEYDPNADWDDGSCQTLKVYGCTNPNSNNYNPWANTDDGTCIADLNCGFDSIEIKVTIKLDNWPTETSWYLQHTNPNQNLTDTVWHAPRFTYNWQQQGQTIVTRFCAPAGPNHLLQFVLQDSYGDGIRGSQPPNNSGFCLVENMSCPDTIFYMSEGDADFGYITTSDPNYWSQREQYCGGPLIDGCTDPAYQEYDSLATNDDGSCQNLHVYGCMDTAAVNYNPNHTAWDNIETCEYRIILEDDGGDGWGESFVGIKQGDSLWDFRLGPGTYVDTFYLHFIVEDNPGLQDEVEMYYFEIGDGQQNSQQIDIQTIQNSVKIENDYGILIHEGNFPWANGNKLKKFNTIADVYTAIPFCGYVCTPKVYGCMDSTSLNYNPDANVDNGTCIPIIYGCTNPLAFNYDSTATIDDGSCVAVVNGCMDPNAWNYNANANTDDGSCIYLGCTDVTACNYDPNANVDNGGCMYPAQYYDCFGVCLEDSDNDGICDSLEIPGCMNPLSLNYNPNATDDDGSCIPYVYGCTDSTAFNYNPLANTDDGSCIPIVTGCTDPTMFNYNPNANTNDGSCIPIIYGCTDPTSFNYNANANTDNGSCVPYIYGCMDSTSLNYDPNANVDNGTCIPIIYGCMDVTMFNYDSTATVDNGSCIPYIYGCMDSTAFNYDPTANTDNGTCIPIVYGCTDPLAFNYNINANTNQVSATNQSNPCIPVVYGCTDSLALNYDPTANVDNGSCITAIPGCTDPNAYNFDPTANVPDSSACLYDAGCITGPGNPYWLNDQCYAWVINIDPYCCSVGWDDNCQNTYDYCATNSGWVGVEDLIYDGGVAIYPNPTSGELNIISSRFKNILVTIYSVSGQIVVNETNDNVIDISHLEDGVYFMNVKVGELTYIRKVIKK